jgi:putative transposase
MLIPRLVGRFKILSAERINAMRGAAGRPVWQRNYYERIIRDADELHRIRRYILETPACWATDGENPSRPGLG